MILASARKLLLIVICLSGLSSCGQTGGLYLPDETETETDTDKE